MALRERASDAAVAEAKAAFLLTLRARGIQDVDVLRALETVPREIFVPHSYQDLARRHLALPLRCGQTLPEPWLAARMIEALDLAAGHRVLEIGTGSGYATALMARIAGEVVSIERFRGLAIEAAAALSRLGFDRASVAWGDGLALAPDAGPFDRIIVQGALDRPPQRMVALLAPDGVLVMACPDAASPGRQNVVRLSRDAAQSGGARQPVCRCRLQTILPGVARAL